MCKFRNDRLLPVKVAGGTCPDDDSSVTDGVKSADDGSVVFNRPFLFLAGKDLNNFTLSVSQKGMLGFNSVGSKAVGIAARAGKGEITTDGDAIVTVEYAYVDLDIGAAATINAEARAAREAELAAIAEREREEARRNGWRQRLLQRPC